MGKKVLIIPYYKNPYPHRQREIDDCLMHNCLNATIDRIVLISEVDFMAFGKIEVRRVNSRVTFRDCFYSVDINDDDVVIVANSDIIFSGLENLKFVDWTDTVLALSRHDIKLNGSTELWNHADSQDVWIFKGRLRPVYSSFYLGQAGADNRIAAEIHKAGYNLFNPAKNIKCNHLHLTGTRPLKYVPVKPPYAFIPVCEWWQVPKLNLPKVLHIGLNRYELERCIKTEFEKVTDYKFIEWQAYDKATINQMIAEQAQEIVFMQIQTPGIIDKEIMEYLFRKGIKVFNWNGDCRQRIEQWVLDIAPFVTTLYTNMEDVKTMLSF